jgi:hypothetical protein
VRIDGKLFLILLGLMTLALAVATLWVWPRLAGRGVRPVAGRIALLLGTQLGLAATFMALINDSGGFYTSWGQLFGTASSQYHLNDHGPAGNGDVDAGQLRLGTAADSTDGGGIAGEVTGVRSGLDAQITVYLPAGYKQGPKAHPLAVEVVDLTGEGADGGGAGAPAPSGGPAPDYQKLADSYKVLVAVVSQPSGPAIPGVNVPEGAQGELFWSQDLRQALATHYTLDVPAADWGIVGVGDSGGAAINLAVQDSGRYGIAAAVGDWTSAPAQDDWPGMNRYLGSVPAPSVRLLYDSSAPAIPGRLRTSDGPMLVADQSNLSLTAAADWLGASLDATGASA